MALAQVEAVLGRPAIRVLPFLALDEEPDLRQLALGLGSDLFDRLARWCWFPVVPCGYSAVWEGPRLLVSTACARRHPR